MSIQDSTWVVTDLETTGLSAEEHRVIEVAAVKVQEGTVVDRFQQLVNPGRSIPGQIADLTGITTGMVFDKPPVEDVLPEYLDFLGEDVLVAHNLSFDQRFLNAEMKRLGRDPLSNDTLCTLRLARRLLPGLDSKGLTRLAQFYDIDVEGRHRALGDAEATSVVLRRFLRQLSFEHGLETREEVLGFQYRQYQKVRSAPDHLQRIREETLADAPDVPGVYQFFSQSGATLYVGKAKSLADRLQDHFTAVESTEGRKRKMLQQVRTVEWESTTTELEALLRESRLIKSKKPRFNRAQRRYYCRPFLRLDTSKEFPALSWTRSLTDDEAEYYGPVRNVDQAEVVLDVVSRFFRLRECDDQRLYLGQRCLYADMDRCKAPCETGDTDEYDRAVDRVRTFLTGDGNWVVEELRERMQKASNRKEFEKAAEFRDAAEEIERVLERQALLAAPVRQRNAVLVKPTDSALRLLFIRFGRFEGAEVYPLPLYDDGYQQMAEDCASYFVPFDTPPSAFFKKEAHEIRLLSHWIHSHREDLSVVRWWRGQSATALGRKVRDAVPDMTSAVADG